MTTTKATFQLRNAASGTWAADGKTYQPGEPLFDSEAMEMRIPATGMPFAGIPKAFRAVEHATPISYASQTAAAATSIPAAVSQIELRGLTAEGDGGAWPTARRISYADITAQGIPAAAYFRSADRFMPDGSTDATYGGYWVFGSYGLDTVTFASRSEAKASSRVAAMKDGQIFQAGGLLFEKDSTATHFTDWAGVKPAGRYETKHFLSRIAANAWAETAEYPLVDQDFTTGIKYQIGPNLTADVNTSFGDAAHSVWRSKTTTGTSDHCYAAILDLRSPDGVYAAGYAASFQAYTSAGRGALADGVPGPEAAGVRAGVRVYDTPTGQGRGGLFEASFPLNNTGATVDGVLWGVEIAVKNFGGSEVGVLYDVTTLPKVNTYYAQGGLDAAAEINRATALSWNGANGPGWFYGHAMRNIHKDYLHASGPAAAGARALNVVPDALWDDSVIVLPEGKGIGAWNAAGTVVTDMLTPDATVAGVAKLPVGLRLGAGTVLDTYEEGTWTVEIEDSAGNTSATTATGYYTRIGNKVTAWITGLSAISTVGMTGTDPVRIILPHTLANHSAGAPLFATGMASLTGAPYSLWADASASTNYALVRGTNHTGVMLTQTVANISGATTHDFCITYEV